MNVVAFNGSPRKDGNTSVLIKQVFAELEKEGISTELVHVGGKPIRGCMACMKCGENKNSQCVITGDSLNDHLEKMFADPEHTTVVGSQDAVHARAELLHQIQIPKDPHQLTVSGHRTTRQALLQAEPRDEPSIRCDAEAVDIDLDHGRHLTGVVVVNHSVDQGFPQGTFIDKSVLLALSGTGDSGKGLVLDIQLIQDLVGGFHQGTKTVLFVFDEVTLVHACVLGNLDGDVVCVGQQVGHMIENAIRGREIQVLQKIRVEIKTIFLVVDFQLLETQLVRVRGRNISKGVPGPSSIESVDHLHGHGLYATSNPQKTTRRRLPELLQVIGFFGATGNDDMDDGFAIVLFGENIEKAEAVGQDVVF